MPAAMPIYFLSRVLEARYCRRLREAASAAGANPGVGGGAGTQNQDRHQPHVICRKTEEKLPIFAAQSLKRKMPGPSTD